MRQPRSSERSSRFGSTWSSGWPVRWEDQISVMDDSRLLAPGDQVVQQPHPPARPPALVDVGLRRAHAGAGDVQVGPRGLGDESLQELGGGDRAGVAAAGILYVGELGVDELVVFGR